MARLRAQSTGAAEAAADATELSDEEKAVVAKCNEAKAETLRHDQHIIILVQREGLIGLAVEEMGQGADVRLLAKLSVPAIYRIANEE